MKLKDKVAIVTGSSRGIGKAIAIEMAKEGARVVVAARTESEQQGKLPGSIFKTVEEIHSFGGEAVAIRTDLSHDEDVSHLISAANEHYGDVDILVNNAGITSAESFVELTVKRWDLLMAVNLRGAFLCTKAVIPKMIEKHAGNIINISSMAGNVVIKASIPYGVSKAALERFTLGLAREMRKHNIAVNALRPYLTLTEGVEFFLPDMDKSTWQSTQMWGKYAVLVASQDANNLTGQILDEPLLNKIFGPV